LPVENNVPLHSPEESHPGLELAKHEALLKNLEALCKFACEILETDHSGFVLFDKTLQRGQVVAQFPIGGFENLLGRQVQLEGVETEQRLINFDKAVEVADLDDPAERKALGSVAALLDEFQIKSVYIVSVRVRGNLIGSFSLDRTVKAKSFGEREKILCNSLAQLASLSIENAFLSDWLEVFQESTKAIISEQEISLLLDTIVSHAVALLEVEEAGIYERHFDSQGEYLLLSASSRPQTDTTFRRNDGGMAWQLIDGHDDFLQTSDYSTYPHQARQFRELKRFGSVLEVPMIWLEERIGVLYVAAETGIEFTEFHAHRLQRIADIATLAIQRCRLLDRIESLSDASVDFSRGLDSDSLNFRLTEIAKYASTILDAEMCGVFRIRHPTIMTLEAGYGHQQGGLIAGQPFQIVDEKKSGLTGAIAHRLREEYSSSIAHGNPQAFKGLINMDESELQSDESVKGEPDSSPSGKCYSLLAVPLLSIQPGKPAMTGLLRISNKRGVGGLPRPGIRFTKEDEWILRIFAEAAAVAIETAELFSHKEAQLKLYRTFSEVLKGEAEIGSRLDLIASQMAVVLKKSYCRILFSHEGSRDVWMVMGAGSHPRMGQTLEWSPNTGKTLEVTEVFHLREMLRSGKILAYSSNGNVSEPLQDLGSELSITRLQSILIVPLRIGREFVGALEFGELRDQSRGRGTFSSVEIELATNPAFLTTELLRKDLIRKRQLEMLSSFNSAVAKVLAVDDVELMFSVIMKEACALLNYDSACLVIQRFSHGPMELVTDSGSHRRFDESDQGTVKLFEEAFSSETRLNGESLEKLVRKLDLHDAASSFLTARLHSGTQSRSALVLERKAVPVFPLIAELDFLAKFATQCSISLTKAVIRQRLQRFREAINLLGTQMAYGHPGKALQNVLIGITHATQCDSVVLYKIDSRSQKFVNVFTSGDVNKDNVAPLDGFLMDTAVGKILHLGDLHVARDSGADPIMKDAFQESEKIMSSAGMPIWIKSHSHLGSNGTPSVDGEEKVNVGVLFLNYKQPQLFTEDEQQIIRLFAPFVALSIKNQELYELEETNYKVQRALLKAEKALSKSLGLAETATQIAEAAHRIAKAAGRNINFVVVKLLHGDKLQLASAFPSSEEERVRKELDYEESDLSATTRGINLTGIVGRAIRENRTELVNDVLNDPDYVRIHENTNSQLVLPLASTESLIGVISIESSDLNTFFEEDRRTFELFARLASDAIGDARSRDDLEQAKRREEAARTVAGAIVLAAAVSHNHISGAQAVVSSARKLKDAVKITGIWPKIRSFFPNSPLQLAAEELHSRATSLSEDLSTQDFSYASFPCIKVNEHLTNWTNSRRHEARNERANLFFKEPLKEDVSIRMQPDLLVKVLDIFFQNALGAMAQNDPKTVWISARRSAENVEIAVSNNGPAMAEMTWNKLGDEAFPSAPPNKGRGILIARTLIESCHGKFRKFENTDKIVSLGCEFPVVADESSE
jgi:GAF domain-containing protein